MNEIIKNIKERRSVRDYKPDKVPKEIINELLEAAEWSANAGNRQKTIIVVSQDETINERLGKAQNIVYGQYNSGMKIQLSNQLIQKTSHSGFYNAPTVVYLFAPNHFLFAEPDSYIVANNICLAAHSIGVDSCIISVAADYFIDDYGRKILKQWNVPENYHISAQVILGYHAGEYPKQKERKYRKPLLV